MDDAALGTLTRDGDRWTLTFTRKLAHSREKVWRAVTEPEHLAVWYPQQIVGERRAVVHVGHHRGRDNSAAAVSNAKAGARRRSPRQRRR